MIDHRLETIIFEENNILGNTELLKPKIIANETFVTSVISFINAHLTD